MHIDFTINIGSLLIVGTLAGGIWRFERLLSWLLVEHEMLIQDYAKRMGMKVSDLPTRVRRRLI